MKRKPSKKSHVPFSDNTTSTVRCKAVRRSILNGTVSTDGEPQWGIGVSVVPQEKLTLNYMAAEINQATSATEADVKLVWDAMQRIIADALAGGQRVELEGLGTLSLEVRTKQRCAEGEKLSAKDVEVKGVSFRPGDTLLRRFQYVRFELDNVPSVPLGTAELADALEEYFTTHEGINTRAFATLSHYSLSKARTLLREYVAEGYLEPIPFSYYYFRPTPGNFGREY